MKVYFWLLPTVMSEGFKARDIGLRAQKKILSRMANKSVAKVFIDDTTASLLDNVYKLAKAYVSSWVKISSVLSRFQMMLHTNLEVPFTMVLISKLLFMNLLGVCNMFHWCGWWCYPLQSFIQIWSVVCCSYIVEMYKNTIIFSSRKQIIFETL